MGDIAYTEAVRHWWSEQQRNGTLVNILEFNHPRFGYTPPTISDYPELFRFTDEQMNNREASPVSFIVSESQRGIGTDQEFSVEVDAVNGIFHQAFRDFDSADRAKPMTLIHRQYLSTNPGRPIQSPVTRLTVIRIISERDTIKVVANARNTPNARVGSYYELDVFRELRYL